MTFNQEFYNYLKPYLVKLRAMLGNDFVIFGSTPLYLYDVVPFTGKINDLDIFIRDGAKIPANALVATFHKNEEQKLYKIFIDDLVVDIGINWPGYGDFMKRIFNQPVVVEEFKFANLEIVEAWKQEMVRRYDRQKDKDYLIKISEYKLTL